MDTAQKKITIVFTDSGLGGLSIMADFYRQLQNVANKIPADEIELIFFNALPESGQGYNRMTSKEQKINTFNAALETIKKRYKPNVIAIACNTLSAIYPLTMFAQSAHQTFEIISCGRYQIEKHRSENGGEPIFILATPTTLASGAYEMNDPITFQISGENLASQIEFDHQGEELNEILDHIFKNIGLCLNGNRAISLFLGCTHYGYIGQQILTQAKKHNITINAILNPNAEFTEELMEYFISPQSTAAEKSPVVSLRIESQAHILPEEIKSISRLMHAYPKEIIDLLRNYTQISKDF